MTRPRMPDADLHGLLADAALGCLDADGRAELDETLQAEPQRVQRLLEEMEYCAAACDRALLPTRAQRLPTALRARVLTAALSAAPRAMNAVGGAPGEAGSVAGGVSAEPGGAIGEPRGGAGVSTRAVWSAAGWMVAAAATIALALLIPRDAATREGPLETVRVTLDPTKLAERRERLLRDADDVRQASWAGLTPEWKQIQGDVVWSTRRQEGYLKLVGLPPLDATREQYQLWIVDPRRDEKHPVDGGVFDATGAAEAIIAIDAKLEVLAPTTFAITREQRGGVVVSAGPLLAAAALSN